LETIVGKTAQNWGVCAHAFSKAASDNVQDKNKTRLEAAQSGTRTRMAPMIFKQFFCNRDGGVAPMLALAAIPIMGFVGAAID
jgi:hypothetical protein